MFFFDVLKKNFVFHILMRSLLIISAKSKGLQTVEESDVSSANNFAIDSMLSGRSFMYTKKSKGPAQVLSPVEFMPELVTNLRSDHREILSRTYQWGNCLKFQQSLVCIVIPIVRPYQRRLRYLKSLLSKNFKWRTLIKICINTMDNWLQLIFTRVVWSKTRLIRRK